MPTVEERLASLKPNTDRPESLKVIGLFLTELEKGTVRAAMRDADGVWTAQPWVKQGILTGSTPIYDLVRGQVYRRTADHPLEIPYGAVVVPGSRPMKGAFAEQHGLQVAAPMIVKYRDEKTDSATALEDALR